MKKISYSVLYVPSERPHTTSYRSVYMCIKVACSNVMFQPHDLLTHVKENTNVCARPSGGVKLLTKINHIQCSMLSVRPHTPFLWLQAPMAVHQNKNDAQ